MPPSTLDLDPTPLTPLGERDLTGVDDEDTAAVWAGLQEDWRFSGIRPHEWDEIQKHYDSLRSDESRAEYVWHVAEARARRPGGMYFFARWICGMNRMIRRVHDEKMGRKFEQVPGTHSRVFLLCHRDSYKSTLAGIAQPLWVLGVRPWERILLSGASDPDTSELLIAIESQIDNNPRVTAIFPYLRPQIDPRRRGPKKWSEKAALICGYNMGKKKSIGREFSIMVCGAEKSPTRLHPTLWIFDDLINIENSKSSVKVEAVMGFVREVMGNLGAGKMPMSGSGTMWRSDDLAAKILAGEIGNFDVFRMPVREPDGKGGHVYNLPREEVIAQLPPDEEPDAHCGLDDETFAAICDVLTDYEIACQWYCDPSKREQVNLDSQWWKTYAVQPPECPWNYLGSGEEAEAQWIDPMQIIAAIDVAVAETTTAKYTAALILGIDHNGKVWVLDAYYDKMAIWQTEEMVFQMFLDPREGFWNYWRPRPVGHDSPPCPPRMSPTSWRPDFVAIEKVGYSLALESGMRPREMQENFSITWEPVTITQSSDNQEDRKRDRILKALASSFSRGLIRVREEMWKPSHWTKGEVNVTELLHKEYINFEDRGHPVDGMDALSVASHFFPMRGRRAEVQEGVSDDRAFALRMLEGILEVPDVDRAAEYGIDPGQFVPAALGRQGAESMKIDFDPHRW